MSGKISLSSLLGLFKVIESVASKAAEYGRLLRGIIELVQSEAAVNPEFAAKLEALMQPEPKAKKVAAKKATTKQEVAEEDVVETTAAAKAAAKKSTAKKAVEVPDVYDELKARGDNGLRIWLIEQPMDILKAIIKQERLDPGKRTIRWRNQEKFADHIVEALRTKMSRGSAFIGTEPDAPESLAS
jgi:hypothetical protein